MKILALSTSGERCGIATYNAALVEALRNDGISVDVHPIDTATTRALSKQEMLHYFDPFLARLATYDALIIQHEYGLFGGRYSSGTAQKVFARTMAAIAASGKPTAIVFHSEPRISTRFLSKKRVYWQRIRHLINSNPQIFAVVHGEEAQKQYIDAGLDQDSLWATRHPLPAIRHIPRIGADGNVTLTIFGFVAKYKGYREAVEALSFLPERFRLLVAGGPHPGNVEDDTFDRLIKAGHPRVEITGWLDEQDIAAVMARTDIVLAPYHPDGPAGSGAVTWGICHGRPVIASKTVTFNGIQEEAQCFAMVPPRDPQALADTILQLAADDAARARMVESGFDYTRKYSWDGMARRLTEKLTA
ncbi:glycosyltransferase [Nitratireductor soli]|uniref:glycosyltransferase n=1 Tax=Nitratireductor soli TaxID=1670619 RepID=UPI00065E0A7D|nr:glycosyltransferase [Nitratireductor soli]